MNILSICIPIEHWYNWYAIILDEFYFWGIVNGWEILLNF
jgi:hypothetical protein